MSGTNPAKSPDQRTVHHGEGFAFLNDIGRSLRRRDGMRKQSNGTCRKCHNVYAYVSRHEEECTGSLHDLRRLQRQRTGQPAGVAYGQLSQMVLRKAVPKKLSVV